MRKRDGTLHLLPSRRRLSRDEMAARVPSRDRRAGRRSSQHRHSRAGGSSGAGHGNQSRDYPEYVLHQMVTVMKGGEEMKISKRAGSYVTVRDLINEVGRDAVRFFFLMRKSDSQLVFDIDVALKQSEENPVYYVQMAHARMCGIFRVGEIDRESFSRRWSRPRRAPRARRAGAHQGARRFSAGVAGAAASLEPHRIATYLTETARLAHLWYHKHHVLGEPEHIMSARLALARATQIVIRNGLGDSRNQRSRAHVSSASTAINLNQVNDRTRSRIGCARLSRNAIRKSR